MKLPQCDREQEVLDALRCGRWASAWGEEIRRHVAMCSVCAEVELVAREFHQEAQRAQAELEQPGAGLPSAGLVWWKAQRAARRAAEQRAAEPILWVERAAYALGALVALGLALWQWPRIAGWLHHVKDSTPAASSVALSEHAFSGQWLYGLALAWPGQTPSFLLAATAVAFLTFTAFAAYVVWRED